MSNKLGMMVLLVVLVMAIALTGCCGMGCGSLSSWPFRSIRTGTLRGSGVLVSQEMDLQGFDKLEVSHAFAVTLQQSDSYRVVVTVDDNLVDEIQARKVGSTLQIGLQQGSWSLNNTTLRAEVSMPRLAGIELSGASSLRGAMDTGDVRFTLSGASRLTLEGIGGDMDLTASGASDASLGGFEVKDASVELSGASQARLNVTGRLDAEASGASQLRYLGNPELGRIESSGASSISPAR